MARVCLKCGYERKLKELVSETECPHCGAIYAKVELALKKAEEPAPANPELSKPAPDAIGKEIPPVEDQSIPEKTLAEKKDELTAYLNEQARLQREKAKPFGFGMMIIPSVIFGIGLFVACTKMFGPLVIFKKAGRGWTIVFSDHPVAWAIIAGGIFIPLLFLWYRHVRRSLKG